MWAKPTQEHHAVEYGSTLVMVHGVSVWREIQWKENNIHFSEPAVLHSCSGSVPLFSASILNKSWTQPCYFLLIAENSRVFHALYVTPAVTPPTINDRAISLKSKSESRSAGSAYRSWCIAWVGHRLLHQHALTLYVSKHLTHADNPWHTSSYTNYFHGNTTEYEFRLLILLIKLITITSIRSIIVINPS